MTGRPGQFWQTLLADLALILFIVGASTLEREGGDLVPAAEPTQTLALWRAGQGAPLLADWLAAQQADSRARVLVSVEYAPGEQEAAWRRGRALVAEAGDLGRTARIELRPGPRERVVVSLHYERTGPELAERAANLTEESRP